MRRFSAILMVLTMAIWPQSALPGKPAPPDALRPGGEPLAIVVSVQNPIENLSFPALRSIFLGNRSHWSNGKRITLVMRDPGDPERIALLREVCGLNENQFKTHFIRGLYTGEILSTPKILSSPLGVRRFIFNVPGAIGYLRLSDVDASVKVLRIDNLQPSDKNYRLHVPEPDRRTDE